MNFITSELRDLSAPWNFAGFWRFCYYEALNCFCCGQTHFMCLKKNTHVYIFFFLFSFLQRIEAHVICLLCFCQLSNYCLTTSKETLQINKQSRLRKSIYIPQSEIFSSIHNRVHRTIHKWLTRLQSLFYIEIRMNTKRDPSFHCFRNFSYKVNKTLTCGNWSTPVPL